MHTLSAEAPAFRYESELVAVVEGQVSAALFTAPVRGSVEVFTEVPARLGVPDVSAVRYDWDVVERRVRAGVAPLTSEPAVRAALLLRKRQFTVGDLATALRMSKEYVRRAVVADLRQRGWLDGESADGALRLTAAARPAGVRVVTVEAKLRDWRGALGQARRQQQSADQAFIALDARAAHRLRDDLAAISRQGVGVMSVDPATNTLRVLQRPSRPTERRRSIVGRTLIAERGLELISRGQRAGEVYPVFGWTSPRP